MKKITVKCSYCNKEFQREPGRYNEAIKKNWNQYCSRNCQKKFKTTRIEKICGNPKCNKKVSRQLHEFKSSESGRIFCSLSCAVSVSNSEFPKRQAVKINCLYCGKEFTGGNKYCSIKCKNRDQIISKKEICEQIKKFYKKHGRIPLKRESHHYKSARSRFGTWNKAIKIAGFKPNPVLFAKKHVANDGHKCDSFAEKIIDNWLASRKIQHKREVPYPENPSLTADFVIKNNWIEFFGLANVFSKYDKTIEKKRILCKKHKLQLIEIYPKDLFPINNLSKILKI